jgi:hypothetical protein
LVKECGRATDRGEGVGDRQRAQGCGRETDRGLAIEADRGCKRDVGKQTGGWVERKTESGRVGEGGR